MRLFGSAVYADKAIGNSSRSRSRGCPRIVQKSPIGERAASCIARCFRVGAATVMPQSSEQSHGPMQTVLSITPKKHAPKAGWSSRFSRKMMQIEHLGKKSYRRAQSRRFERCFIPSGPDICLVANFRRGTIMSGHVFAGRGDRRRLLSLAGSRTINIRLCSAAAFPCWEPIS